MKTLIQRSVSGTIYVLLILGSLLVHELIFVSVFLMLGVLATLEFAAIKIHEHVKPANLVLPILFTGFFIMSYLKAAGIIRPESVTLIMVAVMLLLIYHIFWPENGTRSFLHHDALGFLYIVLPFSLAPYLIFQNGEFSGFIVLCMFLIIWVNDIMAYVIGILLGRHKLYPRISPKKSWEGFIGGVVFSGLAGFLIHVFTGHGTHSFWILYSIVIAVFSSLGDLFESMLKRQAGVKDTGNILPGHGGILDRVDSALFAIPVTYLFFDFFM